MRAAAGPGAPHFIDGRCIDHRSIVAVWALGATQVIGYGTLYYAFSILAAPVAAEFRWPQASVYGAFSVALLMGGLLAPIGGRWTDRYGAGRVMVAGSAAAALALVATALAPGPVAFALGLIAVEAASTLVLYDAAFVALSQVAGADAKRRIVQLTLIGGFASTLFWPLTGWLLELFTWREILVGFAALHLLVCAPLHLLLVRRRAGTLDMPAAAAPEVAGSLAPEARPRAFLLLVAGFAAGGFLLSGVLVHLVPLLGSLGLGAAALLAGSLFGPAQVLSRLINMAFGRELAATWLAVIGAALPPLAILLLLGMPSWPAALAFAVVFGLGSGLSSIVRGTVPLMLFGSRGYGARLGSITAIRLVATAAAPFAFALVLEAAGPAAALWGMAAIGLFSVVALLALTRFAAPALPFGPAKENAP